MNSGLQINNKPREDVPDNLADLPLVTIAWRAMKRDYRQRLEERKHYRGEHERLQDVLVNLAEEIYKVRLSSEIILPGAEQTGGSHITKELAAIANRMEEALASAGIEIIAPAGATFTTELMEMFDNVAQLPNPVITMPRIAQILSPAIICRDAVLRMGKAVIEVPTA